ncbi:MAG: VWA domain-containing protein [Fimbriimonadales bacterium]|nr:VWA domain-containing protein [Fimbriimonadales bacterium]
MQFQSLGVLLWFLPVAGFIILLYLLKVRRREVRVPAKFLFPAITTDVRANALFQKLRPNLLLFLQLLAALLLLTALARPMIQAKGLPGQSVIVVDNSASMSATDTSPTRLDAAKNRLRRFVQELNPGEQLAIIESGAQVRVLSPLTSDKQKLLSAIDQIQPTDAAGNLDEALRLAAALVGKSGESRIVLLSDGAFPPVSDFSAGNAKLIFESLGSSSENLAVTAMDVQERSGGFEWFVGVRNFGSQSKSAILEFYSSGKLLDARSITVEAGKTVGQTLTARQLQEPLEARLKVDDTLASDNAVFRVGVTQKPIRVLLVGEGNFFLERALALEPNVQLSKAPTVPESERGERVGGGEFDLIIFDKTAPVPVKARAVMVIRAKGGPIAELGQVVRAPRIAVWEREHPLMRYLELGNLLIDNAPRLKPASWAKILAESQQTPLIVAGEHQNRRWIGVGWNLMESDFPLQPAFPIFIANLLRWAVGEQGSATDLTVRTGVPFSLAVDPSETELSVRDPNGQTRTYPVNDGAVVIPGLERVGLHTVQGKKTQLRIAANLMHSDESDIRPRTRIELGGKTVAAQNTLTTLRDLWKPIALALLALLMAEWWVFVRRS